MNIFGGGMTCFWDCCGFCMYNITHTPIAHFLNPTVVNRIAETFGLMCQISSEWITYLIGPVG